MRIFNSLIVPKNVKGETLLGFAFQGRGFGCVQNQVLNTFGKSESFTSGTYAMSEKSDEKN